MTARKKTPTAAGKTGGSAGGGLKQEDTAAADSASSALAEADLLDGAALGGVLPGVMSSLTEHLDLGVFVPAQTDTATENAGDSTSTATTGSSSSWQGSDIGGPMLDDDGYVATTTTSDTQASAAEMTDQERALARAALTDWGVSPETVSMMSDADLVHGVAGVANAQLLGAQTWDDLTITPTSTAVGAAAAAAQLGGSFTVNEDGSISLYNPAGEETVTIPAGEGGEGAYQDAVRSRFGLHSDAPVPSKATFAAATALANEVGGEAVASVDGDMNVYDAGGNLIRTYEADVLSQLEEIGEQIMANAAKTQNEAAAAGDEAGKAFGSWLTDTVTALADSGSVVGTPEDQTSGPPPAATDEEDKPAEPGAAAPAAAEEDDKPQDDDDDDDNDNDDDDKDENDNGIPDDEEDEPAEPAADAPAAGMPTPDGGGFDPAAYQRFLDSPLGKGAAELEEAAVGFRAGGSGAGDPVDDVTSVDTATLLAGTPFGDAWNESVRDGLEGVAGGGFTDPTDDGTGSSGTVDARSVADLAARRGGGVTDPPEDRGSGVAPPTLQGPATPMPTPAPDPQGGATSIVGSSIAGAVDDGIEANISQHLDLGGLADRLQVRIDVDVDLSDDLDLD